MDVNKLSEKGKDLTIEEEKINVGLINKYMITKY